MKSVSNKSLMAVVEIVIYMKSSCDRSSDQILLFAVNPIINTLDSASAVCAAFLNLQKAFDSLDDVLLERIQELGSIMLSCSVFRTSYLSNCYQQSQVWQIVFRLGSYV